MNKGKTTISAGSEVSMVLLTMLFAYLKVNGHFPWDWKWVFAPLWLPIFVLLVVAGVMFIVIGLSEIGKK